MPPVRQLDPRRQHPGVQVGNETPRHGPDHKRPDDHSSDDYAGPREECGVFGVWAPGEEVAKLTYFGLYALQHRGQEAAGIAVSDGSQVLVFKDLGLVSQVFDEQVLSSLTGHIAVGHCRYSTTGSTTWENAQPTFHTTAAGSGLALGHNGNLVNTAELMVQAGKVGARNGATTDSDLITGLLAAAAADIGIENAAQRALRQARAQGLRIRVRLPGPAGHQHCRAWRARHPGGNRSPAGQGASGRRRPGHSGTRIGHPGRDRLRRRLGPAIRQGPG